jgi:hypothetical protein
MLALPLSLHLVGSHLLTTLSLASQDEEPWDEFDDDKRLGFGKPPSPKARDLKRAASPSSSPERASLEKHVSQSNKGFQMMLKMGWKKDERLGKRGQGDGLIWSDFV